MSILIPEKISSAELIEYMRDKPDLMHLKNSFIEQKNAYETIKDNSPLMAFFALAAATEIYMKIHYIVVFWIKRNNYTRSDITNICHLVGQKSTDIKISIKRFKHDILSLVRTLNREVEFDEETFKTIEGSFKVFGEDWTTIRYSTDELRKPDQITHAYDAFCKLQKAMQQKGLDVINKIEA